MNVRRSSPAARSSTSLLIAASLAAFRYRDRARQWLDQRFFREEYDARKILLSLASRVRFETDPARSGRRSSSSRSTRRCTRRSTAILVSGIDDGPADAGDGAARQRRVAAARRRAGRDAAMVGRAARDLPRRSAVAGAAAAGRGAGVAGVHGRGAPACRSSAQDRALVGASSCSARSDRKKPYTREDRQLLGEHRRADGARVRRRAAAPAAPTRRPDRRPGRRGCCRRRRAPMMECPRCGRCEESGTALCPADGAPLQAGAVGAARRRQQVPHRAAARARRHGRGLPRARHAARSAGRAQGRPRRAARRSGGAAPLPARGADRRAAAAPGHRVDLRLRHASPTAARTW